MFENVMFFLVDGVGSIHYLLGYDLLQDPSGLTSGGPYAYCLRHMTSGTPTADLNSYQAGSRASESHRFGALLRSLLATLIATPIVFNYALADEKGTTTGPPEWAATFVNNYERLLHRETEIAFRQRDADRMEATTRLIRQGGSVLNRVPTADVQFRSALLTMLEQTGSEVAVRLIAAAGTTESLIAELLERWRTVRSARYEKQLQLFEVQANKRIAGQLASLLSVDNRWFWLCGLMAIATLVAIASHERRHEIRRWLYGGRARAMRLSKILTVLLILFACITAATFFFGDEIYRSLITIGTGSSETPQDQIVREGRELSENLNDLQAEASAAEARYMTARTQCEEAARTVVVENPRAIAHWLISREQIEKMNIAMHVQRRIADQLNDDSKAFETLTREIAAIESDRGYYDQLRLWVRCGLGALLLGVTCAGGLLFHRGVRRRLQSTRNTCPLCLGVGTFDGLEGRTVGQVSADEQPTIRMVKCNRPISNDPYEECGFTFAEDYRSIIKLCFPTLGIPQAGKTHWLAMTYRELNRGNCPAWIRFERIKSTSSERFDRIVDEILDVERRIGPEATQTSRIPHPLVFHFSDHDRMARSHGLVNIFDYSGEVTRSHTIEESAQRQRALDADGYFFFLDPTEPSETQVQALVNFRDDLRLIKRVKPGQTLRTPVALVVSKIDLMVNEAYADSDGNGVVGKFYRDLAEIRWDLTLQSIEARSRFVAQLRDTIWPGWDIERSIHDLFGGRYMFFPLTPVGLNEPGELDLSRRTISPLGLFQPLLWLLHMNGYRVLTGSN